MKELNLKTVILVVSLSFILLSIPAPETVGASDPSIEEVTQVELGTVTSNYYHISDNTFDRLYSSEGKLKLSYNTEAILKVNVSSAEPGIDLSDLEISLLPSEDNSWKSLGDGTPIELGTFTNTDQTWDYVEYQLRYTPDKNDSPGNYSFSLKFELTQLDLIITVRGNPGPGNEVNLEVTDNDGPVGGASIEVNDQYVGTTNPGGVLNNVTFPEDDDIVVITATHGSREATRVFDFSEDDDEEDEDDNEED